MDLMDQRRELNIPARLAPTEVDRTLDRTLRRRPQAIGTWRSPDSGPGFPSSTPRPSSRSACLTQRLIAHGVGPNCRERSVSVRPARCSSTIWCRSSFEYRFANFDLAMAHTSNTNCRVCTEPGPMSRSCSLTRRNKFVFDESLSKSTENHDYQVQHATDPCIRLRRSFNGVISHSRLSPDWIDSGLQRAHSPRGHRLFRPS